MIMEQRISCSAQRIMSPSERCPWSATPLFLSHMGNLSVHHEHAKQSEAFLLAVRLAVTTRMQLMILAGAVNNPHLSIQKPLGRFQQTRGLH